MRRIIWLTALLVVTACGPTGSYTECRPPEGGIGGTGAPDCAE